MAFVEFSPSTQLKNEVPEERDQKKPENEMSGKVELVLSQKVRTQRSGELNPQVDMLLGVASSHKG